MVGIVVVAHSEELARGACEVTRGDRGPRSLTPHRGRGEKIPGQRARAGAASAR